MQSSLKKTLYLGLAALSFVSVAGAANNSANAAKRTKHARVTRFNPDRQGMDQGQVWQANGKNNIYATILGRNRKEVANASSIKGQYFMAYQQENNQKGQHYYKVVDFNGNNRGWIYNKGVDKTNATSNVNAPAGNFYLANPGSTKLMNAANGSVFHSKNGVALAHTDLVKLDPFKVMSAVKVNNSGDTYYQVADQNQPTVTGWVKASDMTKTTPFDASKDIKVNLTDNKGNVVKSYTIDANAYNNNAGISAKSGYNNGVLDNTSLFDAIQSDLTSNSNGTRVFNGTSYDLNKVLTNGDSTDNTITNNNNAIQYVKKGDTINLQLPSAATNNVKSHLVFSTLSNGTNNPETFGANDVALPKLSNDQYGILNSGLSTRQELNAGDVFKDDQSNTPFNTISNATDTSLSFGGNAGRANLDSNDNIEAAPNTLSVLVGTKTFNADSNGNVAQGIVNNNSGNVFKSDAAAIANEKDQNNNDANKDDVQTVGKNNQYHLVYVLRNSASVNANNNKYYGNNLTAYYNVYAVNGPAYTKPADNTNTNYLG